MVSDVVVRTAASVAVVLMLCQLIMLPVLLDSVTVPVHRTGPYVLSRANVLRANTVLSPITSSGVRVCHVLVPIAAETELPVSLGIAFQGTNGDWYQAIRFTALEHATFTMTFDVLLPRWQLHVLGDLHLFQTIQYSCTT
jgi:hypothetical protein